MTRRVQSIKCSTCSELFSVEVLHAGFDDSEFLYCDHCHRVAVLNIYSGRSTALRDLAQAGLWTWRDSPGARSQIEALLAPCECGGHFTFDAVPRCPHCRDPLILDSVLSQLDARGWWKQGWRGVYCLITAGGRVDDPLAGVPSMS